MNRKDYQKIIDLCINYGTKNPSYWWTSLDFFINKDFRSNLNEEEITILNNYLEIFLEKLLDSGIMFSINILDIINEKNNDISLIIL